MRPWKAPKYPPQIKACFHSNFLVDNPLQTLTANASIASPTPIMTISINPISCPPRIHKKRHGCGIHRQVSSFKIVPDK